MRPALFIRRPDYVPNAQRRKEVLLTELHQRFMRRGCDHRHEQMITGTALAEILARRVLHRQRQRELHPLVRAAHLLEFLLAQEETAIEP